LFIMISKLLLRLLTLLPLLAALPVLAQVVADTNAVALGRRIYLEGMLPDGQPLRGVRLDTGAVTGTAAACVSCHRPSGLGMVEGTVGIPPISGRALFGGGEPVIVRMDQQFNRGLSAQHPPYTDADFAAVVRDGQHPSGRVMHALMPRYTLTDAQLHAVASYLKTLSNEMSPAVVGDTIHMATVIAPGLDPERRQAFINTLTTAVEQMNISVMMPGRRQKMVTVEERRLNSRRKWALDIWELSGPSSTWGGQLAKRQHDKPVFAIVSGLAKDEWQPVHDFCENNRVGCWFPSVDLVPAGAAQSRYSLYFSAGIATEAEVIVHKLGAHHGRVVQLVAADPVARSAAAALRRALATKGAPEATDRTVVDLDADLGAVAIKATVAELSAQDTLVLWLRPTDLMALTSMDATTASVFVSATLGGGEQAELPMALREHATLVQPLEEPGLRAANLERLQAWMNGSRVPMVNQRLQSEVFFAVGSLQATLRGMLNNLHPDYLIERAEATLSGFEAMQVQDEIQATMMGPMNKRPLSLTPPTAADNAAMAALSLTQRGHLEEMRRRGGTTVYPRLSLGQGQRFASKGAYLERLNPDSPGIIGEPLWVVP
jgi:mono/diheme cytochrome c family protein